ncbi:hypothetical protein OROMI_009061 [Orobanche minor]
MKVVLNKIEGGADSAFSMANKNAPDVALNKLLVHGLPVDVCYEDLHKVIPGSFTVEVKTKKIKGNRCSAFAIFKNQHEADEAFDCIEGDLDKDFYGRLQKVIHFQPSKMGVSSSFWICKMAKDSPEQVTSPEFKSTSDDSKKWTTNHDCCESHLKEIERLKLELELELSLADR